jgi:hypothetical protein
MTCYPPTTLLPSYLPYADLDDIVTILCDKCLAHQYNNNSSSITKDQHFDLTVALIEFWTKELSIENETDDLQ